MNRKTLAAAVLFVGAMAWLHALPRTGFSLLFSVYSLAFGTYLLLVSGRNRLPWLQGLSLALVVRLACLPFFPACSDDVYRFVWDGMLSAHGLNPLAYTPDELMTKPQTLPSIASQLYTLLNHTAYHTTYPPVAQWLYRISFWLNGNHIGAHVLFLKGIALLADAGVVLVLARILRQLGQPGDRALWYALNPLVILELDGNLHFEGVMILGLLGAITLGLDEKRTGSIAAMAFSGLAKLHSLLLAPFLPGFSRLRHRILCLAGLAVILAGVFLASFGFTMDWIDSLGLWYGKFEFNAGLYYILRWIGFQWKGYNLIQSIGPWLAGATILFLGWVGWHHQVTRRLSWQASMIRAYLGFLLLSTTVHPWYLTPLLALGLVGGYFFPVAWSYLVFLSYSHYDGGGFREHCGWIAVEYALLAVGLAWEWKWRKRKEPLR